MTTQWRANHRRKEEREYVADRFRYLNAIERSVGPGLVYEDVKDELQELWHLDYLLLSGR